MVTFRKKVKSLTVNAVKSGIAYLIPYFEGNTLKFMCVPSKELIPLWTDAENSRLDGFIRFYDRIEYRGTQKIVMHHAEYWSCEGVQYFSTMDGSYHYDGKQPHFRAGNKDYNWAKVPLIWLKYNDEELPLAYFVKELVDSVNWQTSVTEDVLRDVAKFIFVLKNYGGQDLAEFINDLKKSLAVKVDSDGGVDTISPSVEVASVLSFLDKQRRDIYDLAAGVDTKDPDLGNASGTSLYFRYMGLDNDCAALGTSLKLALMSAKTFIDTYLQLIHKGDFSEESFSVVFNTDMPVNETEIIGNCKNSVGMVSNQTILENHPWVKDVTEEQSRLDSEKQAAADSMGGNPFEDVMLSE